MKILFVINDAPYGNEKAYNTLRLIMTLQNENPKTEILIFLLSDAVSCALIDQSTPQGYYNIERMLKAVIKKGAKVKSCGSCIDARGLGELKLLEGVEISGMSDLAAWLLEADKTITF
ncbi:hypothetical protein A3K80_08070 [Candidatus Bathyarchaeota archaeon RBG_13_38_9]|nr:MAG: hypothetical protein A3K80_08070 [Candidatus Bathyarchaeota archaeon RBG_13_38_9]